MKRKILYCVMKKKAPRLPWQYPVYPIVKRQPNLAEPHCSIWHARKDSGAWETHTSSEIIMAVPGTQGKSLHIACMDGDAAAVKVTCESK